MKEFSRKDAATQRNTAFSRSGVKRNEDSPVRQAAQRRSDAKEDRFSQRSRQIRLNNPGHYWESRTKGPVLFSIFKPCIISTVNCQCQRSY